MRQDVCRPGASSVGHGNAMSIPRGHIVTVAIMGLYAYPLTSCCPAGRDSCVNKWFGSQSFVALRSKFHKAIAAPFAWGTKTMSIATMVTTGRTRDGVTSVADKGSQRW